MYPYHNRIIQRIRDGELIGIEKGKGEFFAVFLFSTPPYVRPIREYAVCRYEKVLAEMHIVPFWQLPQ